MSLIKDFSIRTLGAVMIILAVAISGCATQSTRQTTNGGDTQGEGAGSQGSEDQGSSQGDQSGEENRKPMDSGPSALIYDHEVSWDFSMGPNGMNMTIDVEGDVMFYVSQVASGMVEIPNQDEWLELPFYRVAGSGNVPINGTFNFYADDNNCNCRFEDSMQVEIAGITQWKPNVLGNVDWKINLELNETWYTQPDWECQCSDPDMEPIARMNMQQMPAWKPEGLTDRTLEFVYFCDGMHIIEDFKGAGGTGTYLWQYQRPDPGSWKLTPSIKYAYDDMLSPDGQLVCSGRQGEWGPPLGTLQPIVATWFAYP